MLPSIEVTRLEPLTPLYLSVEALPGGSCSNPLNLSSDPTTMLRLDGEAVPASLNVTT